ncbi:MAG: hypothetical protein ACSLFO_02940 [Acidimicrobiales bacterium]
MLTLPTSLRARMAMVTLLGIFLIPLTTSSLRGLTHVLSCTDEVPAILSVDTTDDTNTVLLGADSTTREEADSTLCDGLDVTLQLSSATAQRADVEVQVTNGTETDWQGSMELRLASTVIPVSIGRIDAGATESDTISLTVDAGRSYEITGTLLIGP